MVTTTEVEAVQAVTGPGQGDPGASSKADRLEAPGFRELAVALGPPKPLKIAGIIAL